MDALDLDPNNEALKKSVDECRDKLTGDLLFVSSNIFVCIHRAKTVCDQFCWKFNILTGPSGSQPLSNPFADPLLTAKLEANPTTKEFMKDPGFRQIMSNLQKDPKQLRYTVCIICRNGQISD